jgi:hypothetical protein
MSRSIPTLILALLCLRVSRAQQVEIRLEPARTSISSCPGETLEVAVRLVNPARTPVAGYQVFLRFPARFFEPVRYDALEIDGHVQTAGFPGSAFRPCAEEVADGWSDGAGEDVVAALASAVAEGEQDLFTGASAELGRFVFRPRGEATAGGGAAFLSNAGSCHSPIEQVTRVFGARGVALSGASPGGFSVAVTDAGPAVGSLSATDLGESVYLQWSPPPLGQVGGYAIYRNSVSIARFSVNFVVDYTDSDPPPGTVVYEVAVIDRQAREGCRASATIERGSGIRFLRGDANRDGRINLTDAVRVLDHLFGGNLLGCLDAGDFDDSGVLNISDAVSILGHLFQPGPRPPVPPPFESPGFDPTPDDLDCGA